MVKKTKNTRPMLVTVPLLKEAQELIKKYWGVDEKGRLFSFITGQEYNKAFARYREISMDIKRETIQAIA